MKTKFIYINLVLIVGIFVAFSSTSIAQDEQIIVIVNKDNPIKELTAEQVKQYYLRKINKRWPEINKSIKLVRHAHNGIQESFNSKILDMSSENVSQYFTQRQFANAETPPVDKATDSAVILYVSTNIGAIGYVRKSSASAAEGMTKIVYSSSQAIN